MTSPEDIAKRLSRAYRAVRCWFGYHRSLHIIQSYGAAQHVGCPHCGTEMAIHHGMRAVLPWDSEIAQLYRDMDYDVDAATAKWQAHRAVRSALGEVG